MELLSIDEYEDCLKYTYTSVDGEFVFITIYSPGTIIHSGDIELSKYEKITINGNEGYVFYNDVERSGAMFLKKDEYIISLSCMMAKSEMIKVAENIK